MGSKALKIAKKPKASVLVLVLIVISSMSILAMGLAYRTRIEIRLAGANAQRTKAYYLALGGIERVKALLNQQELSPSVIGRICSFSNMAEQESLFSRLKDYDAEALKLLAYSLRDEQGYLNINKSDPASWEKIESISKQDCAGILDWTDADDDTTAEGAETDFYERLNMPYVSKNNPCATLKELLFIRGISRDDYLGQRLGQEFLPTDNGQGLVDIFTVYGNGKININTASEMILAALPGFDEQAGWAILNYRAGVDGPAGTDDDVYLADMEDLANLQQLTELQIELLRQYCCFDSEYFRIFSYSRLKDDLQCCLMATVKSTENNCEIITVERLL